MENQHAWTQAIHRSCCRQSGRVAGRHRAHGDVRRRGRHHHVPCGGAGGVQPAHRPGDDPGHRPGDRRHAAVRHQQQGAGVGHHATAGWTLEGTRLSSTDTETILYSKVAAANDAGTNAAVTFSATTKSTLTLLAYDGTAADPVAAFASAAETVNRTTHTTPGGTVATAGSYVVSYWADKSADDDDRVDAPGRADPALLRRGHRARAGSTAVASDTNAPVGRRRDHRPAPPPARVSTAKATMWTVVLQADQTPEHRTCAPVASFTASCPHGDLHGRRLGFHRHRARHASRRTPGTSATAGPAPAVSTTHTYTTSGGKTVTLDRHRQPGAGVNPDDPHGQRRPWAAVGAAATSRCPATPTWCRTSRATTPRASATVRSGTSRSCRSSTGSSSPAASPRSPTRSAPTTTINQANLASYNLTTGLIDTSFRPTFNGGVSAVEASPDGTKLFVGGSFNTVNGVAKQKVASLNLTTGAPLTTFGFTNSTNNAGRPSLAATNDTVYVGGRFTRINGVLETGLAAVNAASGVVDQSFDNQLSGGIGVNGQLGVPQLKLTHDNSKLLVVHTGRQIDGQDRLGIGIIDTATKQLLPFRSRLWDENLARLGGVTRIYNADIAPDDSYFVVTSGSGGDAPPISDTAVAYPLNAASLQNDDVQPLWISRHFDSDLLGGDHRAGGLPRWTLPVHRVARPPTTRGQVSTTSATAPARVWPATASATRWSVVTTSPRCPRRPARRSSGTRPVGRTPSRATRPWRPPRAACSSAATACSRAVSAPGGSRSTTSTP